jgi:hypothetical protein
MEHSASIQLKDSKMNIRFEWSDYDGDDCFNNFQVLVAEGKQSEMFDFGACAIFGLRKLSKFFSDLSQETAGLGFRNPDIRYCDVFRNGKDYRLVIQYEGNNLHKEFNLSQPVIHIKDEFLKEY